MLLMIDNYDSFTFNLVQYLQTLGAEVEVVRNDALTVGQIRAKAPERIMISPGPGEIMILSGASLSISATVSASLRTTFTSAPNACRYCTRLKVKLS